MDYALLNELDEINVEQLIKLTSIQEIADNFEALKSVNENFPYDFDCYLCEEFFNSYYKWTLSDYITFIEEERIIHEYDYINEQECCYLEDFGKFAFSVETGKRWNDLPDEVTDNIDLYRLGEHYCLENYLDFVWDSQLNQMVVILNEDEKTITTI